MIICLSPVFAEIGVDAVRSYRLAFENLLRSHAYGWHLFVPDREISEVLAQEGILGENPRRFLLSAIGGKHATLIAQARSVRRHVLAYPDGQPPLDLDGRQIPVPLRRFENMDCCAKAELLTENAGHDGELFEEFAALATDGPRAPISLKLLNGGGDTFANELIRDHGRCPPRLAIADSDRIYPGGPLGQTAAKAATALGQIDDPVIELKITHGRAIENYFPPSVVSEIMGEAATTPFKTAHVELLEEERKQSVDIKESMCLHISWKKGVRFGDLRKTPAPYKLRLELYVQKLGGNVSLAAANDPSQDSVNVVAKSCARLIQRTHQILRASPTEFANLFANVFDNEVYGSGLVEMSETVLAYGLAPARSAEPV